MTKSPEQFKPSSEEGAKERTIERSEWYHLAVAESALWREAPQRAYPSEKLKKEYPFSVEELQSIGYAWKELDPEIKELTRSAFPEVAAFILAKKLEKSSLDAIRKELEPGEDIEVVTKKGHNLFNFKGMSVMRAKELGHKLGVRPLTIEESTEKTREKADTEGLWGI